MALSISCEATSDAMALVESRINLVVKNSALYVWLTTDIAGFADYI